MNTSSIIHTNTILDVIKKKDLLLSYNRALSPGRINHKKVYPYRTITIYYYFV